MDDSKGIKGRRIHFAGSADAGVQLSRLDYTHKLVKQLAKHILLNGGGLVVTVGSEPLVQKESSLPLIFDWTLLEALDECRSSVLVDWPKTQGLPVVAVGLPKWREKIPHDRKPLWESVVSSKNLELVQIRSGLSIGGVLREQQAAFGDILVGIGGGPGVEHLADLYISNRKPVIPLDIPIKTARCGAAERLSTLAMETPERFFEYHPSEEAAVAYSRLSLKHQALNVDEFSRRFFEFLSHLPKPRAFFVRILNHKLPEFNAVERFFRNVIDPAIKDSGYERFEMGIETSHEPFLNVEIFQTLHCSSLVIADLTGLRPNCFMELGYALGLNNKVIMTAKEGTKLPFDSASIPCHFWSEKLADSERKILFEEFMRKNISRRPLVS